MRNLKYNTSKFKFVVGALLALLGLGSCDKDSGSAVEYGCPSVDLKISGTAKSPDGTAIKGIRVVFDSNTNPASSYYVKPDTTFTNSSGGYVLAKNFMEKRDFNISFEDIDGAENGGEFAKATVHLNRTEYTQSKKGSGNWYQGTFEASRDINLHKK